MKGLTLTQPWATLVAIGAKEIETRSWSTGYRGWLAIHAAKGLPVWAQELINQQPFAHYLSANLAALPRGAVVAVAKLEHVGRIDWFNHEYWVDGRLEPIEDDELEFGDYATGRYGWVFSNVRRLPEPVPCRGALGLWDVPPDVLARIKATVAP